MPVSCSSVCKSAAYRSRSALLVVADMGGRLFMLTLLSTFIDAFRNMLWCPNFLFATYWMPGKRAVIVPGEPLFMGGYEHGTDVVNIFLIQNTGVFLERPRLCILVPSVYGEIIFTADQDVFNHSVPGLPFANGFDQ